MKYEPEPGTFVLSHKRRRERKAEIQARLQDGDSHEDLARDYGLEVMTIVMFGREVGIRGIRYPRKGGNLEKTKATTVFSILRELLEGTDPPDIAREYKVSRQYVHQVKERAVAAGFVWRKAGFVCKEDDD